MTRWSSVVFLVAVAADSYRGQGHGKALLALVLDEAGRTGLSAVRMTVTDDNATSRHIIQDAGWQLVGEFTARTGERCRLFGIALRLPPPAQPAPRAHSTYASQL